MNLDIRVQHYRLTFTHEWVWDVCWGGNSFAIRRWLVAALFVAWRRSVAADDSDKEKK